MPELPEVETVRRSLARRAGGARVVSVDLRRPAYVTGARNDRALLLGAQLKRLERRGRQIAIIADSGRALCVNLGMTGGLRVLQGTALEPTHTHILWRLRTPAGAALRLAMTDPRRFGGVWTFRSFDDLIRARWADLGPDALTVTDEHLADALAGTTRAVKAALLDQRLIAGVGNIYADEALFAAGVHPAHPSHRLARRRAHRLAQAIRATLAQSLEAGGSTIRDYRDADNAAGGYTARHAVYGRSAEPCVRCAGRLGSAVIAGRTTVWCPRCQRRPRPWAPPRAGRSPHTATRG